jgi:hypothetical protein
VTPPEEYCREIEAYLCRKNDGHLIRIVGPAFEQVSSWANEGIPLKVALAGVDRYFERYYRKGPRRRPVRIEFCEADVRDAFDDWRRAVGVARVQADTDDGDSDAPRGRKGSLASHVERAVARLTSVRGSTQAGFQLTVAIDEAVRRLDRMQADAKRARGDARTALTLELEAIDRQLTEAAIEALDGRDRERLVTEAERELAAFRGRMLPEAFAKATHAAFERLVRERFALPSLQYE